MAEQAPAPPLHVTSAFLLPQCAHAQVFRPEYRRSNRNKGLKILRYDWWIMSWGLLPGWHIDQSYCGTSLSVRVNLPNRAPGTAVPDPPPSETLAVFARFETVSDVSLQLGECVESDMIQAGTQTENNPRGEWVSGALDRPSGFVTQIRTVPSASGAPKPLIFRLNGNTSSRWYYDWESGANKVQRLMKHVLKAYVMERCAVDVDSNFTSVTSCEAHTQLYRVLDVVVSPAFTVTSYRRGQSNHLHVARSETPAETLQAEPYQMLAISSLLSPTEDSPPRNRAVDEAVDMHQGSLGPPLHTMTSRSYESERTATEWGQAYGRGQHGQYVADGVSTSALRENYGFLTNRPRSSSLIEQETKSASPQDPVEDKLLWEHTNAPAVTVSKNLALLYSFLRWAPLQLYAPLVDELVHVINHKVLEPLAGASQHTEKINCFSRLLLNHARMHAEVSERHDGVDPVKIPRQLEALLRITAQATLWFFSEETRQWLRSFFCEHAEAILDKNALRSCFILFVCELKARLESQVFAATPLHNLTNVAEEVIGAVYSNPLFHSRRLHGRGIVSGASFEGWKAFVAQMRDAYVSVSKPPDVPGTQSLISGLRFDAAHLPSNSIEKDWNAEWLLHTEESTWSPTRGGARGSDADGLTSGMSLLTVFEIISYLARLELAMDVQGCVLSARSTQSVAGRLDCTRMVLDGKERVFRLFPNGLSTNTGRGDNGDYVGEMRETASGQLTVHLELFSWGVRIAESSYHVRMHMECCRDGWLSIDGHILTTTAATSYTPDDSPCIEEMTLRDKNKAVQEAHARQLQGHCPSGPDAGSAWEEYGRFQLRYHRM